MCECVSEAPKHAFPLSTGVCCQKIWHAARQTPEKRQHMVTKQPSLFGYPRRPTHPPSQRHTINTHMHHPPKDTLLTHTCKHTHTHPHAPSPAGLPARQTPALGKQPRAGHCCCQSAGHTMRCKARSISTAVSIGQG